MFAPESVRELPQHDLAWLPLLGYSLAFIHFSNQYISPAQHTPSNKDILRQDPRAIAHSQSSMQVKAVLNAQPSLAAVFRSCLHVWYSVSATLRRPVLLKVTIRIDDYLLFLGTSA